MHAARLTARALAITIACASFAASPALAQDDSTPSTTYELTWTGESMNARVGLGLGLSLPGFATGQIFWQSFGAISNGLYTDFRFTASEFGDEVFGDRSPTWQPSVEFVLRGGYGLRSTNDERGTIRDSEGRRIIGRFPTTFGAAPFIGYRGRIGYNMHAFSVGIHLERDASAEVEFADGRLGDAFGHWAADIELLYAAGNEQKGLGVALGFDHYFGKLVFLRSEFGWAQVNPNIVNDYSGQVESAKDGFFAKFLLCFVLQFDMPTANRAPVTARNDGPEAAPEPEPVQPEPEPTGRIEEVVPAMPTGCMTSADCQDGIFCNGEEICIQGTCSPGRPHEDGIACTETICDEGLRTVQHRPMHGLCGDGIFCNGTERCDGAAGCIPGLPLPIDDGNPCTNDSCDENTDTIINDPIPMCRP